MMSHQHARHMRGRLAAISSLCVLLGLAVLGPICRWPHASLLRQAEGSPEAELIPSDPRVFSPSSRPFGKFYGEWGAEWWQWVLSIPATENPLLDETGEKCMVGQRGPVWFLVGVLNVSGKVTRACSVPEGTAILYAILNAEADYVGSSPEELRELVTSGIDLVEDLREFVKAGMDDVADPSFEVDGIPVRNLQRFRFTSPVFSFTLPQNNIYQALGVPGAVPQTWFPAVSEGFYVMLKPLPAGEHTLRSRGRFPSTNFLLDITYHLTIVPVNLP